MIPISRRLMIAALCSGLLPAMALAQDDKGHIIHLMKGMFDTPDSPLLVEPVVVRGDNAIASWMQGEKGGRALLWRIRGEWQVRLCSGDGLKDAGMLVGANISPEDAKAMVAELTAFESTMDPSALAKFASFEGTVTMDGHDGQHSHSHGTEQTTQ
jgi:hypothetical protein